MNTILLLGEFSALHKNLKEGLQAHGVQVTTASTGDSWKAIGADISLGPSGSGYGPRLQRVFSSLLRRQKLVGYDVVQFVWSQMFTPALNSIFMKHLARSNGKSFLLAAGCDATYNEGVKHLRYSPCESCLQEDELNGCPFLASRRESSHQDVCGIVDGIIPIMYDYAAAYRSYPNVRNTLPLPLNVRDVQYQDNKITGKLKIFHGINREGFKGTSLIRAALAIVKQRHPNDVEVIVDGKMPLAEYLELLKTVNVVIDQCHSYSYAMNALYSLAQGKVVLSGAEPECLLELGIPSSPVINICPDVDDIVTKLETLIAERNRIPELGQESRAFVETYHNAERVAGLYLKSWRD